jgi:hypothetical protein
MQRLFVIATTSAAVTIGGSAAPPVVVVVVVVPPSSAVSEPEHPNKSSPRLTGTIIFQALTMNLIMPPSPVWFH